MCDVEENNAIAIVDVASASVRQVVPLGYKGPALPRMSA